MGIVRTSSPRGQPDQIYYSVQFLPSPSLSALPILSLSSKRKCQPQLLRGTVKSRKPKSCRRIVLSIAPHSLFCRTSRRSRSESERKGLRLAQSALNGMSSPQFSANFRYVAPFLLEIGLSLRKGLAIIVVFENIFLDCKNAAL